MCAVLAGSAALILEGCNESLPPRDSPQHPIDVTINFSPPPVIVLQYFFDIKGDSMALTYVQDVTIAVNSANSWDEVLQDSVDLHGTLTIWDADRPQHRTNLKLDQYFVSSPPITDGLLTLLPGRNAVVNLLWYSRTNDPPSAVPEGFWQGVHVTNSFLGGVLIQTTDPIHLAMQASVQLFSKAGRATSPITYVDVVYEAYFHFGP